MRDVTVSHGPPPGWYDDGVTAGVQRWFNGTAWTEYTRPLPEVMLPAATNAGATGAARAAAAAGPSARAASGTTTSSPAVGAVWRPEDGGPAVEEAVGDAAGTGGPGVGGLGGGVAGSGAIGAGTATGGFGVGATTSSRFGTVGTPAGGFGAAGPATGGSGAAGRAAGGFGAAGPATGGFGAAGTGAAAGFGGGTAHGVSRFGAPQGPGAVGSTVPAPWGAAASVNLWAPVHAHWGWRVLATAVDQVLVLLPYAAGAGVLALTQEAGVGALGRPTVVASPEGLGAFVIGALLTLVLWFANRVVRQGRTGQSWGKQLLGLRAVHEISERPIGLWWSLVREVGHVVDAVPLYLGYLWPLWDGRRQTFADKLCHAVVLRDPR